MPRCTWKPLFFNDVVQIWPSVGDSLTLIHKIKQGASSWIKQKYPEVDNWPLGHPRASPAPTGRANTLMVLKGRTSAWRN